MAVTSKSLHTKHRRFVLEPLGVLSNVPGGEPQKVLNRTLNLRFFQEPHKIGAKTNPSGFQVEPNKKVPKRTLDIYRKVLETNLLNAGSKTNPKLTGPKIALTA